jgi:hypothetical protein
MWGTTMDNKNNDPDAAPPTANDDEEEIPAMQRFLDNPFILLVLGIAIPTVFYIVWGIIEITQIPIAD